MFNKKELISKTSDYELWAEISKIDKPEGCYYLKVTSKWANAKDPDAEQVKFRCFLSKNGLANLSDLLKSLH